MRYTLLTLFSLLPIFLTAQNPAKVATDLGLTGRVSYLPHTFNAGQGFALSVGGAAELALGQRRRSRVGLKMNLQFTDTNNQYENNVSLRNTIPQRDNDTTFAVRAGQFTTQFFAVTFPISYRFQFDGVKPWSIGLTYRPGFVLAHSVQNAYVQYDIVQSSFSRVNQSAEITEASETRTYTDALTLDFAFYLGKTMLGTHFGLANWSYTDDYIGGEQRWLLSLSATHWLGR
ncbi:MAG: hypothetical protein AAF597_03665 [Bacteroidota bacterium]